MWVLLKKSSDYYGCVEVLFGSLTEQPLRERKFELESCRAMNSRLYREWEQRKREHENKEQQKVDEFVAKHYAELMDSENKEELIEKFKKLEKPVEDPFLEECPDRDTTDAVYWIEEIEELVGYANEF